MHGKFVISLDFELMWGVRDKKDKTNYGQNILAVHSVIPRLLALFKKYQISATFSTVGFLFYKTKQELINGLPLIKPDYVDEDLSPYTSYIDSLGDSYLTDLFHFAPALIDEILKYPEQEIGTHTFSHYYCLENGQSSASFKDDLYAAIAVAKKYDISLASLVFPRNQFNEEYLRICAELGIITYRGNEQSWLYKPRDKHGESTLRRGLRLIDAYLNISGHNCYTDEYMKSSTLPLNIPSSRFLRPFSKSLKKFDYLRLGRIKSGMTYAAKNNLTYHLWWHPHNFGNNTDENFLFLEKILLHYTKLQNSHGFQSYTMKGLAEKLINE